MKKQHLWLTLAFVTMLSCKPAQYQAVSMKGSIVEMNDRYDGKNNEKMATMIAGYKKQLDKEMNQVVGESAQFMNYGIPESLLTNFTSDAMKAYAALHLAQGADIAVMNVHGHRATMPKGDITMGNLYEIYSFDNTITFLELSGKEVKNMFDSYAKMGGAGISSNVRLVVKDKKVKSVTIDNQPIDENKTYKIVTLDYLADGNNGMEAFLNASKIDNTGITLRDIMIDYVKEKTNKGEIISSKLDGRIVIEN